MADINRVVLVGRLTRDAELRYTNSGTAICKFSVAVNRWRKSDQGGEEEAHFFDVVLWGRQGEAINQYLTKGKQVGIDGELRQSRWEQDGQPRSRVEVAAFNVQLLGGGRGGPGGPSPSREGDSYQQDYSSPQEPSSEFEDDIPF
jgi:single-strand DNA-binding protein